MFESLTLLLVLYGLVCVVRGAKKVVTDHPDKALKVAAVAWNAIGKRGALR